MRILKGVGISVFVLILLSMSNLQVAGQARVDIKSQFLNKLEKGDSIKIGALGTSLTGGAWRWFDVMAEWLDESYSGQLSYHNEGVGASASSYPVGKSGIDKAKILASDKPDVVFIEFAVNDAYQPYNISVEDSRRNLEMIIQTLQEANPDVEIILQTMNLVIDMPELNMKESTKRSDLLSYNEMYRNVAAEQGLLLIDHYQNWSQYFIDEGREEYVKLVKDGIHPSLEGYRLVLLPELKSVLQNKWVLNRNSSRSLVPEIDDFLSDLQGQMRLLFCKYDKSSLVSNHSILSGDFSVDGAKWQASFESSLDANDSSILSFSLNLKLLKGQVNDAGFAMAFDFDAWNSDNYVMFPASVYDANRCSILDQGYNEGLDREFLYKKDIPLMSVPIPQLSPESGGISRLEVNSSNMSTPAMCFYDKEKQKGFIVLAEQKSMFADHGFIVEENVDRTRASFVISMPGVRERKPLFVGFSESNDRGANFNEEDSISLKFQIYSFDAQDIPEVLSKFMEVRKSLTGKNNPRDLIPFSQVAEWMTERIDNRWYADEKHQFYCPENANWISFGWIGGLMNTFPMLALGDEMHLARVTNTFDFAIPRGQGESGYFHGALNYDGVPFPREGYPDLPELVLTRKNADVLFWMIKQFMLLKSQGNEESIDPVWESNIKRLADAFVNTWKTYGQWGRMLNNQTGEVAEFNTSGGVMAIGGLALASRYYTDTEYLTIAQEAANHYYQKDFVETGMTTGGCADILQNADSETAAGLMTSLMALYEVTNQTEWLLMSQNLANLVATWTTSYDYELPPETELGRLGAKLAGVYWASTQNKHGAPGICTNSGDPLFKIFRSNGNELYADLLNDIIHAHGESIRPGGYTNERLTYCDADSRGERGTHITGWNELNGFLMALEIPGIYVQTDGELFYVFDHVQAKVIKRSETSVTLEIYNPTDFDANVSIMAETTKKSQIPLGYTSFLDWPKTMVKSGEIVIVDVGIIDD